MFLKLFKRHFCWTALKLAPHLVPLTNSYWDFFILHPDRDQEGHLEKSHKQ